MEPSNPNPEMESSRSAVRDRIPPALRNKYGTLRKLTRGDYGNLPEFLKRFAICVKLALHPDRWDDASLLATTNSAHEHLVDHEFGSWNKKRIDQKLPSAWKNWVGVSWRQGADGDTRRRQLKIAESAMLFAAAINEWGLADENDLAPEDFHQIVTTITRVAETAIRSL